MHCSLPDEGLVFVLTPGYYHFVTQGRSLFDQLNEFNRDGNATWSYEYAMHVVPEPAGLWLAAVAAAAVGSLCGRRG